MEPTIHITWGLVTAVIFLIIGAFGFVYLVKGRP
jgi:hypothetical protein